MEKTTSKHELTLKIDTTELSPTQVRLLKTIHVLLSHVATVEEESEYFETSAELFKKVSELIAVANFPEKNKKIPYGQQAVEYALDLLNESVDENDLKNLDN